MNAIVQPMGQPAPGSAKIGNLYADLQSRTLWLGVDLAVDATGSVLISDMLQSMAAVEAALDDAKAYTDDKLLSYAPLESPVFTGDPRLTTNPPAADNDTSLASTAFVQAAIAAGVANAGLLVGMILMYSGPVNDIGTGIWAKWHLCDGTAGTPDLRNRFVFGAGYVDSRTLNTKAKASTNEQPSAGAHTHDISYEALTVAQLPAHSHGPGVGTASLAGYVSTAIAAGGSHAHIITCTTLVDSGSSTYRPHLVRAGNNVNAATDTEVAHTHPGSVNTKVDITAGKTSDTGSGGKHTHTTQNTGSHVHSISSAELRDAIPSMAIAYIMKIS